MHWKKIDFLEIDDDDDDDDEIMQEDDGGKTKKKKKKNDDDEYQVIWTLIYHKKFKHMTSAYSIGKEWCNCKRKYIRYDVLKSMLTLPLMNEKEYTACNHKLIAIITIPLNLM